jgi:prephenate dehydrogenase
MSDEPEKDSFKIAATTTFGTLAVIGLGLIGGSLAMALRQAGVVRRIIGCDTDNENLQEGLALGVIDEAILDIATAVHQADIVFVALPVGAMRAVFAEMNGRLAADTLVTDGGSTKGSVIADFAVACPAHLGQFVPGHPIAGKEKSGVGAATAKLYQDRTVILTPTIKNTEAAIQRIQAVWQACGAKVVCMQAAQHDQSLAMTSHLPHMLAYTLMQVLDEHYSLEDLQQCSAGGLRDITRVAGSNPQMWRDIALANRVALQHGLQAYARHLNRLIEILESTDSEALYQLFAEAQQLRQQLDAS